MSHHLISAEVATIWTSPQAPRDLDAAALEAQPDVSNWLAGLTPATRLGLHGRTLTQASAGEPAVIVARQDAWAHVRLPWQPAPQSAGYLGWLPAVQLGPRVAGDPPELPSGTPSTRSAIAESAREFLGLRYLWGGTSPAGFDCSGLVHWCYRRAGIVVPRDAYAQRAGLPEVPLGTEAPGDLYYFCGDRAETRDRITHVGFVIEPGRLLHAPEDAEDAEEPGSGSIVEEELTTRLSARLTAVGRVPLA